MPSFRILTPAAPSGIGTLPPPTQPSGACYLAKTEGREGGSGGGETERERDADEALGRVLFQLSCHSGFLPSSPSRDI